MQPRYYDKIKLASQRVDKESGKGGRKPLVEPYSLPDLAHCGVSSSFSREVPVAAGDGSLTNDFLELVQSTVSHLERVDDHEEQDTFRIDQDVRWRNHTDRFATETREGLLSSLPPSSRSPGRLPYQGRRRKRPVSSETIMNCVLDESFDVEDRGWLLDGELSGSLHFTAGAREEKS